VVEIKFCGLTRAQDAATAAELRAAYAGVIFAGGPRLVSPARAREVFAGLDDGPVQRVGVFGAQPVDTILEIARETALHVLQLAGETGEDVIARIAKGFDGAIWPVLRVRPVGAGVPASGAALLAAGASAVVLDAAIEGRLGGTGVALDWRALAPSVQELRQGGRVVLAGGLTPENVAGAVALVAPDVVDVSSGVESAPGSKEPQRMRAFASAVRGHEV
jgi:phosphoribosylanthranilate isomerase